MNGFRWPQAMALFVLLAPCTSRTQEFTTEDRFGKTVEQVLTMTPDKWSDWYTDSSRGGGSTAGMAGAERIYADCLAVKIDSLMSGSKILSAELLTKIDKLMMQIEYGCLEAGGALTGGGTMWIPIGARADVKRKEAQLNCIQSAISNQKVDQNQVWAAFKQSREILDQNKSDIEDMKTESSGGYTNAVNGLESAKAACFQLTSILSQLPSKNRVHFLVFARDMFRLVKLG